MQLRTWISDDLESLKVKLSGGILERIPPERRNERVDGGGIAPSYIIWHMARHHDVTINGVVRAAPSVVEAWTSRLGLEQDLWRGLAEAEDQDLVDVLDPEAVGHYALSVIDSSASWLASLDYAELAAMLDSTPPAGSALDALGTPRDRFDWLYGMWQGKTVAWFLKWSAIGHGFNHLGELVSIRNRMGLSPF